MTDRIPLDHLNSDQYDELCDDRDRLGRLRSLVGAAADEARGGVRDWLVDALAETADPREPSTAHTLRQRVARAEAGTDGELRRQLADAIRALGNAETELAGVRALRDRWVKAGPPPLGTPTSRWWDRRLVELGATLQPAAHNDVPPVHVGGRVNAEDCPACSVAVVPPPYPWICPGPG
ncbi:hypothetical protein [Streptomyces europaeiscabiei]|uniref:hypothetical protein n=1 Tax=Streptomyces europaeiscabiei TaxID=146819 RepID=UPI000E67E360|nr:hypothetical protein [Streptomyces europaeiscabiei]